MGMFAMFTLAKGSLKKCLKTARPWFIPIFERANPQKPAGHFI
jgi:hypothetical protein